MNWQIINVTPQRGKHRPLDSDGDFHVSLFCKRFGWSVTRLECAYDRLGSLAEVRVTLKTGYELLSRVNPYDGVDAFDVAVHGVRADAKRASYFTLCHRTHQSRENLLGTRAK